MKKDPSGMGCLSVSQLVTFWPKREAFNIAYNQKYSRLRYLLLVKGLVIYFHLGWSGNILQIKTNVIKVGSNSWLFTCSSDITLSLASYTVSAL